MMDRKEKSRILREELRKMGRVAVAFSCGVDSAFLLKTAHEELGENCLAITADSPAVPRRELEEAKEFCRKYGIGQILFPTDELTMENYASNPADRCYHCKKRLFGRMWDLARERGCQFLLEGSNADDPGDYRPGMKAVEELNVVSPLKDAGFSKKEIRECAKEMGLDQWNKPSFACLASRFPYGQRITEQGLRQVEQAEEVLRQAGFSQYRVRKYEDLARVEVPAEEVSRLAEPGLRGQITEQIKAAGFRYVTLDMEGFRSGSMNERLGREESLDAAQKDNSLDLGYANVDLGRKERTGVSEVIYGEGKTAEQIAGILEAMKEHGQKDVLVTRLSEEKARETESLGIRWKYHKEARLAIHGQNHEADGNGTIAVVCAGTSDLPVAEEAALTAEFLGNKVMRIYDVGVAGIHRLLAREEDLRRASVVIAVAGMEGALASVVGGLVSVPVIAVPTSVGYGAGFQGLAALLAMMNSCASGVTVVNIDNGFGAGFSAHRINHPEHKGGSDL